MVLAGCGSAPAGDAHAWRTRVPAGFPLTQDLPRSDDGMPSYATREIGRVVDDPSFCGKPTHLEGARIDRVGAWSSAPDRGESRVLHLYPDARTAQRRFARLEEGARSCAGDRVSRSGLPGEQRVRVETTVTDGDHVEESAVTQVVRVGNAVLVASLSRTGPVGSMDVLVAGQEEGLAPVAEKLCVFAASPCGDDGLWPAIPDDVPLGKDRGLTRFLDDGGGTPFDRCDGRRPQPALPADWVRATSLEADDGTDRQVLLFGSDEEAGAALDALRAAARSCPVVEITDRGGATTILHRSLADAGAAAPEDEAVTETLGEEAGVPVSAERMSRAGALLLLVSTTAAPTGQRDLTDEANRLSTTLLPGICAAIPGTC